MFTGGEGEAGPVGLCERGQWSLELVGQSHVVSVKSLSETMRAVLKIGLTGNHGSSFINNSFSPLV